MKKVILPLLVAASAAFSLPTYALVTVNYQFLTHSGGTVPAYNGAGVPGFGTGHYWNPVVDTADYYQPGIFSSTNGLADDGTTSTGIGMTINTPGNNASTPNPGSIVLLDSYAAAGSGTTGTFTITNIPSGTYNLVVFGANGIYHGNVNKFTVSGVSLIATNNSDTAFIQNANFVVFSNLVVSTGQLSGTWTSPLPQESDFNGVQLQQVSLVNPAPAFSPNPPSATPAAALYVGANVSLSTKVSGNTPLHLQWQVNKGSGYGNVSATATNSTLNLSNVKLSDMGSYRLTATNTSGGAVSQPVALTVDSSQQAFTANFQWISSEGGVTPVYTGQGVPGYGTGTYWNTVPGPNNGAPGAYTSTNSLADDGVFNCGVTLEMIPNGSQSTAPITGSLSLLDSYANAYDGNTATFIFNNTPPGNYNVVLFGDNGTNHGGNITMFTVNNTSQTLTNVYIDNALVPNVTYVAFNNVPVSGPNLTGTWQGLLVDPKFQIEGNMTGAQLQLVGPVVNTVTLTITPQAGGQVQLSWSSGTLMQSSTLGTGASWSAVPGASAPSYTTSATGTQMFYRVQVSP